MARNPNSAGSGPKVTKQGKTGPIVGNNSSKTGSVRPWGMNKGSNKTLLKGSKKPGGR